MPESLQTICAECGAEFLAPQPMTISAAAADLCSRCQQLEDAMFVNDPTPIVLDAPRRYSRAWMQELLGVSGDEDV